MASIVLTGANRGIGLGLVKEFLRDASYTGKIFATARSVEQAKDLTSIKDPRLRVVELDLDSDDSILKAAKEVESFVGSSGVDVLLNNSGVLVPVKFDGPLERANASRNLEVNAVGTLMVTQAFLPLLRRASSSRGAAKIVNISSALGSNKLTAGSTPRLFLGYSMSKAAINMMTSSLAVDLKGDNIHVVAVEPGWVATDMGGSNATLSVEKSTSNLAASIKKIGAEHSGGFFGNDLKPRPF